METIDDLDEVKILGYFESVQGNFLFKLALLLNHTVDASGEMQLTPGSFDAAASAELQGQYPKPAFYAALRRGNVELVQNLSEDIATSLVIGSWMIFEQIVKHVTILNYAHDADEQSMTYHRNIFGFTSREKKDLDLFYYVRNAIVHYNGAYYAAKAVNHRYRGRDYDSREHVGEKIELTLDTIWHISADLERYACQAWFRDLPQ